MMGERFDLPLGEVCDVKQGRYLGPGDMSEVQTDQTPIPVIGANGILGYTDQVSYAEPVTLVTCRGSNCGMLQRTKGPTWISNNAMACPPKKPHDSRYIHYVLQATDFGEVITGSAQPQITTGHLNTKLVTITRDQGEQKRIAEVLGTLDDKIELNRRMNATLEATARALFQSWFVDFDPVRAKLDLPARGAQAGGRTPSGMDAAIAALFPDAFEESSLGHIPKGWEVRNLDKSAHYLNGLALQKYPPGDGPTLPVIKIAQLRKGDSIGADRCNTDLPPEYIVQDGDVLFSWSGSLEVELWCGGTGALNQHLFKVTSPEFPKWFYYLWTLYHLDEFRLIAADKATTMGHIQRGHLTAAKVLIPQRPLLDAMSGIISPLIEQLIANRIESRTLANLRDTLLPKLLSGELSLKEAA
jgi:type I restriction enzyme S subunit